MRPSRGSGWIVPALLLATALAGIIAYGLRDRGAWLRVPEGRAAICISVVRADGREPDLTLVNHVAVASMKPAWRDPAENTLRWAPSSLFRPAYLQHLLAPGTADSGSVWEEFIRDFSKNLGAWTRDLSCRVIVVSPDGEQTGIGW